MKKIEQLNLIVNKLLYEDYKSTERADNEIYEIADIAEQIDSKQGLITINNMLSADLVDDRETSHKFVTSSEIAQIKVNKIDIGNIQDTMSTYGNIVTHDVNEFMPSTIKYGSGLGYIDSVLSLKDQDGHVLDSVIIKSSGTSKIDNITITQNALEEIQALGVMNRKNNTPKYDWVGTLAEYEQAVQEGQIPENYVCYITDDTGGTLYEIDWGNIVGNINDQTDLKHALDDKYDASNPSNFITLTNLSSSATGLLYNNATGDFSLTSGYIIPTTTDINTIGEINATISSYGDIVSYNAGDFATSAQGALADTALQSGDNITELSNNANYITLTSLSSTATGLTYNNTTGELSLTSGYQIPTTTEVSKANTALQPNDNISELTNNVGYITLTSLSSTATGLTYNNTTGELSLTSGYTIPTTTEVGLANSALQPNDNITELNNNANYITLTSLSSTVTGLTYNNSTGELSLTSGYQIPTTTEVSLANSALQSGDSITELTNNANYITLLNINSTALGLTFNQNTGDIGLTSGYAIPTTTKLGEIDTISSTIEGYGNIVTYDNTDFLGSSTKYGASLGYSNDTLTLEDQDGNTLDSVTIKSSPDVDETTITYNASDKLQASGALNRRNNTAKYDWIGTLSEYQTAVAGGLIPANYICYITDDTGGRLNEVDWGDITGNINDQTDLKNALDSKYNASNPSHYIALTNLSSSATGLSYNNSTGVFSLTSGYRIPTTTEVGKANSAIQPNDNITQLTNNANYITLLDINSTALGLTFDQTTGTLGLTSGYQIPTTTEVGLANTSLQPEDIADNTSTTTVGMVLSANMGKSLQDQVNALSARGRFLSLWDCTTGLAETQPPTLPYDYKAGDYFIVGNVGTTNYKPTGSEYTGVASTVVETEAVDVEDVYYYDGTVWHIQINTQKTVTFSNVAGSPYDNTNLASALNGKYDASNPDNFIDLTDLSTTATGLTYNNSTGVLSLTSGYTIPTTTEVGKANSAIQPNDNITQLTNNANYITLTDLSSTATGLTYDNTTGIFSITNGYQIPTTTEVGKANSALQSGDNITELTNNANYIDLTDLSTTATGLTYNNTTGVLSLTSGYGIPTTTEIGKANSALQSGDNISELVNNSNYITLLNINSTALGLTFDQTTGDIGLDTGYGIPTTTEIGKANSALQSGDNITELTNNANYITLLNINSTALGLTFDQNTGDIGLDSGYGIPTTTEIGLANSAVQPNDNVSDLTNDAGYITASSTDSLTNKTFDANGTGNSISNIETDDFASGVIRTSIRATSSASDTALGSEKAVASALDTKQDELVSGTNIKTINNTTVLGNGNFKLASLEYGFDWKEATQITNLGSKGWKSLIYDGTQYIAVSVTGGFVSTSVAGTTWTSASQKSNLVGYSWSSIGYNGTRYVLLGLNGYISTSAGTTNWTAPSYVSSLGNKYWQALAHDGTKFVALGRDGYISTSTDGTTWTSASYKGNLGNNTYWMSIAWGADMFVALSSDGHISTSTNGTTWTSASQKDNLGIHSWNTIIYDGTKFIALSYYGYISTSTDGTTWSVAVQKSNLGENKWRGLAAANSSYLVAIGNDGYVSRTGLYNTAVSNIRYNELFINFEDLSEKYLLLDGSTGKIPEERLPDMTSVIIRRWS